MGKQCQTLMMSSCLPPSQQVTQVCGLPGQLTDHLDLGTPFSLTVWVSLSMKYLEMSRLSLNSFQL